MAPRLTTAMVPMTPPAHPPGKCRPTGRASELASWVVMGHPPFPFLAARMASSYISAGMKSPVAGSGSPRRAAANPP